MALLAFNLTTSPIKLKASNPPANIIKVNAVTAATLAGDVLPGYTASGSGVGKLLIPVPNPFSPPPNRFLIDGVTADYDGSLNADAHDGDGLDYGEPADFLNFFVVKNAINPKDNGFYFVQRTTNRLVRSILFNQQNELVLGTQFLATNGTANAGKLFKLTTVPTVLDTDPMLFTEVTDGIELPASTAPGVKGPGVNVGSELHGLTAVQYEVLAAQQAAGDVAFQWTGSSEFSLGAISTPAGNVPANAGETGLTVIANIGGTPTTVTLKFGADGTGPGGVGRALYFTS